MDEIQRVLEISKWFSIESKDRDIVLSGTKYTIETSGELYGTVLDDISPLKNVMKIYNERYDVFNKYIDKKSDNILVTYNLYVIPLIYNAGSIIVEIKKIDEGLYYRIEYVSPIKITSFPGKDGSLYFYEMFYNIEKKEYMESYPYAIWNIVYKLMKTIIDKDENTNT